MQAIIQVSALQNLRIFIGEGRSLVALILVQPEPGMASLRDGKNLEMSDYELSNNFAKHSQGYMYQPSGRY